MENSFKALIMGGAVLLFVVGVSVGVLSYSRVMEFVDAILTTSEENNRTAENFTYAENQPDTSRKIDGAEIVASILEMGKTQDYTFQKIRVGGKVYTKDATIDEADLKKLLRENI